MTDPSVRPTPPVWLVTTFFVCLTVLHTWPLATDPAHLSRLDTPDGQLNAWIIAWIAHALATDPLLLFDANIFHPAPRTLAFSEPLLVPGLLGAPVLWLGGSPALAYNLVLLVGLVATAVAMYALVLRMSGDPAAGLCAGALLAFNAHTLTRFTHLQAFHMQWLPLSLWALDRLVVSGRRSDAGWLGLFVALAALTSGHLVVFCVVALATTLVVRVDAWLGPDRWRLIGHVAAAAIGTVLVVGPLLWPYLVADDGTPLRRGLEGLTRYAATWQTYLAAPGRLHFETWSEPIYIQAVDSLFPGIVCLSLSVVALVSDRVDRRHRLTLLAVAVVGGVLSLGPVTPLYSWLYALLPPVQAIRATSRFGYLFLFGLAGLAGLGLAAIRARARPRWTLPATALALALVTAEALRAPVGYTTAPAAGPIHRFLGADPTVEAVVELPLPAPPRIAENAAAVYASTLHWRPLVNGYSGLIPRSYVDTERRLRRFPSPSALRHLDGLGVTHVVVHLEQYAVREARRLERRLRDHARLELLAEQPDGARLYRVRE